MPWSTTAGVGTFFFFFLDALCISHGELSERERAGVEGHSRGSSRSASYSPKGLRGFAQSPESDLICQFNNFTESRRCYCCRHSSSRESSALQFSSCNARNGGTLCFKFPCDKVTENQRFSPSFFHSPWFRLRSAGCRKEPVGWRRCRHGSAGATLIGFKARGHLFAR